VVFFDPVWRAKIPSALSAHLGSGPEQHVSNRLLE
jgi:hypothetical protein